MDAKLPDGSFLLNSSIRKHINARMADQPERFARPIDAAMLDQAIAIISNPRHFDAHFRAPLERAFPLGDRHAKETLSRLIEPRNRLYHANPISTRQAEQIICYAGDTIDSIKAHYREIGMEKEYIAPMIIRLSDNYGSEYHEGDFQRNSTGRASLGIPGDAQLRLRPGDVYRAQVEIHNPDPESNYHVDWVITQNDGVTPSGTDLILNITTDHVRKDFSIWCRVVSDKDWHRCGDVDDSLHIPLKILPPAD
ncbi:hypothetical protein [Ruegeria sp. HKCCD6604]|uniref:hypothetical protein n=1 Tax=Ruegeria sp. HKCCD6604 TaxID=2683000 RepID=UPI001C105A8E|nr:hypothetical protein [Ruegeria sp. HKCCD6604]